MMFMKISMKKKIWLISLTIHKIQSFLILLIKHVIGKLKDEFKDKIISAFDNYSLVNVYGEENKKVKGVNKNVVKKKRIC